MSLDRADSQADSEALLEEVCFFNLSLDLLAISDLKGYFKRVNPAFTQVLGYSETELLTRPLIEFVHPDDQQQTLAELEKLKAGAPTLEFENRYRTLDGSYRWLSWRSTPQLDRGVIYGIARDVTQQKQTEASLRASEERWQLALRGSNDGIWDWNVQTNEVFFSTRWKTMLGYEENEISNQLEEWSQRVHPDDLERVMQIVQDHFDQKVPFYVSEHRLLCKDGTYKWILDRGQALWNEQGEAVRMVGSHTDITERKLLEAALHVANETLEQRVVERTAELEQINRSLNESEFKFHLAVDHIPDIFVIYDAERRLQFVNAACSAFTGQPVEAFLGRRDEELYPPDVTDAYLPLLKQAVATKQYQTGEVTLRFPGRDPYTIIIQYVPLLSDTGEIQQILGITHDITQRIQSEQTVRQSEQQIRRILDSLFSFVGVMTPDGILIEANRTAIAAAGLDWQDILNKPFEETYWWSYSTAVQNQLRAAIQRAATGETVRYDAVIRVKNNQLITIDFTLVAIFDASGRVEYLIPSGIDITERKRAEMALQESQTQVQQQLAEIETIYQSAPIGLSVLDRDLRFVRINQRLAEMNGFSIEQHLGRTVRQVLPELAETAEAVLQPILETGEPLLNVEIRGETPAQPGVERVWLESFLPLEDGGRVIGINIVCEEISDRKQAEQQLRDSKERLRLGMQVTGFALATFDYATQTVELSPEAAALYGLPTDELIVPRSRIHATFHPDERDELLQMIEQVLDPNGPGWFARDHRVVWPSGEVKWLTVRKQVFFDRSGDLPRPTHAILVALDITERKQAEEDLRQSETRYQLLFETMEDGFCVIEILVDQANQPVDYRFLEVNPAFERQAGLHQAVGKTARELVPNLEAFWIETYGRVALTGEPVRLENGSDRMNRWFEVYAYPVGQPEQHRVAILFKDISERKAIETQREALLQREQAAREAAERANRIKDEFLAVLSHELRTPLNPILGWAKLLQSPRVGADKLQQGLTTIERNAQQQVQLIDDLLDISRIIRGKLALTFTPVNLASTITNAVETVRLTAEAKGIQLEVLLNPVVFIRGDAGRLQQVVWNLLSNAIKFTPTGGRVEVRLDQIPPQRFDQALPTPDAPAYAQITVIDTGKGIQPDFLPHVFELFRQQDSSTTRAFGGLGLGLGIARQIVEAHGGTITVASAGEGQGATFTVQLPIPVAEQNGDQAEPE